MTVKCSYCGEEGHTIQQCPKWKRSNPDTHVPIRYQILDKLAHFQHYVDGAVWDKMFVEQGGSQTMARHLWMKFDGYDHSILRMWRDLDTGNRVIVAKMIESWKGHY